MEVGDDKSGLIVSALAFAGALLLANAILPQAPDADLPSASPAPRYTAQTTLAQALAGKDARASKLIGRRVVSPSGTDLGEVEDLLATADHDAPPTVVISTRGVLHGGDKWYATSFGELLVASDGRHLMLDRTMEELAKAPPFDYVPRTGEASGEPGATGPRTTSSIGKLFGATVVDERDKSIGEIDDLVVSSRAHSTRAIVELNAGAGHNADGRLVAIPFDELHVEVSDEEAAGVPQQPRVHANLEDTSIEALPPYQYSSAETI